MEPSIEPPHLAHDVQLRGGPRDGEWVSLRGNQRLLEVVSFSPPSMKYIADGATAKPLHKSTGFYRREEEDARVMWWEGFQTTR